jgi:cytochrome P450
MTTRRAPGPSTLELLRRFSSLRNDTFRAIEQARRDFGDIIRIDVPYTNHLLSHPRHLRHVFETNAQNYLRRGEEFREVEPLLGEGVLLANGDKWARGRRLLAPEFWRKRVVDFIPVFVECVENFSRTVPVGQDIDVTEQIVALTLEAAAQSFFGVPAAEVHATSHAVELNSRLAADRIRALVKLPLSFPTPRHLRARRAIENMNRDIFNLIERYKTAPSKRVNVLSRLMASSEWANSGGLDAKTVRDEIVTILVVGHETTASTLFWCLYELAKNPGILRRLQSEVDELELGPALSDAEFEKAPYLRQVIFETMRVYPALASLSKTALRDDEIDGFHIPAGSVVNVCVYLAQRHPDFWPDPERFDPERFTPAEIAKRDAYAFAPFGAGPRRCIGEHFAMVELLTLLACLVKNFDFELNRSHPVKPVARISTAAEHGIRMKLYRR